MRKTILGTLYSDIPGKKLSNDNLEEEVKLLKKKQDKILSVINRFLYIVGDLTDTEKNNLRIEQLRKEISDLTVPDNYTD